MSDSYLQKGKRSECMSDTQLCNLCDENTSCDICSSLEEHAYINNIHTTTTSTTEHTPSIIHGIVYYNTDTLPVKCLIDTGALQGDYCSERVETWLVERGGKRSKADAVVCSPISKKCVQVGNSICISNMKLFPHDLDRVNFKSINFEPRVLKNIPQSSYDIIIGVKTIIRYKVLKYIAHRFMRQPELCGSLVGTDQPSIEGTIKSGDIDETINAIVNYTQSASTYDQIVQDDIELGPVRDPAQTWDREGEPPREEDNDSLIPKKIFGSPQGIQKWKDLCKEYKEIFSRTLRETPADLPPFNFEVDLEKWLKQKPNAPPRNHSLVKQMVTNSQVNKMQEAGIVEAAPSIDRYSQVHLEPKTENPKPQDEDWRFCIDFRHLNDCSAGYGWPLANINLMLDRLSSRKPKWFAKIDMTKGYYQLLIAEHMRKFTAFITFAGVFQWCRVPMGLKGAAAFFQYCIAQLVITSALLYIICEVYRDDILIYGEEEDQLIEHARKVFERFRVKRMTLNPDKCEFGLTEVEFVGHLIKDGSITFTDKKLSGVREFPRPDTWGKQKQFLGLANYFRDHIRNFSILTNPLEKMILGFEKKKRKQPLVWTEEQAKQFELVKAAVSDCQELYFIEEGDNTGEIHLRTDACDYGIGAYLSQSRPDPENPGKTREFPIRFISKTLSGAQLNWSVPEKECYAIVYALTKLEHLLIDRKFVLYTDHENLTRIYSTGSAKVQRWRLRVQDFNMTYRYLKAELNGVADDLSRLCDVPREVQEILAALLLTSLNYTEEGEEQENDSDEEEDIKDDTLPEIPEDIMSAIKRVHNALTGHHGVDRSVKKLKLLGYDFKYMRRYVSAFVKMCPCCQKMSRLKVPIRTSPYTLAAYRPMQRLYADTIMCKEDKYGFSCILVVVDAFTRFVELYACKDATSASAARALLDHIGRYGCPTDLIVTDNGAQFVNSLISEITGLLLDIEHATITPHSHEENGLIERANKEIMRHLRALIFHIETHDALSY